MDHRIVRAALSSPAMARRKDPASIVESDEVFELAADLFAVLATPLRLKLISALCHSEKNVSTLLSEIDATQPNVSQHLGTLYRAGILAKRREGTQIFYRLQSERAAMLCRAVCTQVAVEIGPDNGVAREDRLLPSSRSDAGLSEPGNRGR
jgi:DNA-binding transcriptional ArsR family regulator